MSDAEPLGLRVSGLTKLFAVHREGAAVGVHPVTFDLEEGTFFTMLGPSGCGKTTTLRCIAGLQEPDSGKLHLGDRLFYDSATGVNVPLNHRNIGMVFQSYAIWPHMTIFENVAFPLRAGRDQRYDKARINAMVNEALDRVDLSGFGPRSPTQLSGGQQQRVALARAIVRHPKLLLLDEPLSNLDAKLRDEMRIELKRLQKDIGITTVYVTHDQSEALEMSDVIAILEKGHLRQIGTPRQIFFEPANAFVAKFMGATNLLQGTVVHDVSDQELGEMRLLDGRSIVCRFLHGLAAGTKGAVSVRPDTIEVMAASDAIPDGWNALHGRVTNLGFLGHYSRCGIQVGDLILQANVDSTREIAVGSDVMLAFPHVEALGLPDAD